LKVFADEGRFPPFPKFLTKKGVLSRKQWNFSRCPAFGFGATEVRATGEVVDLAMARPVTAFSIVKQSSYTWLDNEAAVRENPREIAQEIAEILIQGK
jgi:hypothetical protein